MRMEASTIAISAAKQVSAGATRSYRTCLGEKHAATWRVGRKNAVPPFRSSAARHCRHLPAFLRTGGDETGRGWGEGVVRERHTHARTHTQTQADTDTDTQTHRHTDRHTDRHRHTHTLCV